MNASARSRGRSLSKLVRFFGTLLLISGLAVGFVSRWSSGQAHSTEYADDGQATVDTDFLNLRGGPSLDDIVVYILEQGEIVELTGTPVETDGYTWYPVLAIGYGLYGWVAGEYLALADSGSGSSGEFTDGDAVVVATDFLNLRADASLSASVEDVLAEGEALTILSGPLAADGYSWYSVETGDGTTGWVAGEYLAVATSGGGSYTGFDIGDSAVVDTPRLNFRAGPGLDYDVIEVITGGASVVITDGPVSADGYHWYELELENGDTGWSIGEGLA